MVMGPAYGDHSWRSVHGITGGNERRRVAHWPN